MKNVASTVEGFSSDGVILGMLNTLHPITIFALVLIPTYKTFPTSHQGSCVTAYFLFDPPPLLLRYLNPSILVGLV